MRIIRVAMMVDRVAYGERLRRERERRGVALESVAQSTKIKCSLLEALERGDLAQWPAGIFGRGFLRAYLDAIHLPAEPWVSEFQSAGGHRATSGGDAGADQLRLTLEPERGSPLVIAGRLTAALAETAVLLALATLAGRLAGMDFWIAATLTVSAYSWLATAWFGRSPALRLMARIELQAAPSAPDLSGTNGSPRLTLARD